VVVHKIAGFMTGRGKPSDNIAVTMSMQSSTLVSHTSPDPYQVRYVEEERNQLARPKSPLDTRTHERKGVPTTSRQTASHPLSHDWQLSAQV